MQKFIKILTIKYLFVLGEKRLTSIITEVENVEINARFLERGLITIRWNSSILSLGILLFKTSVQWIFQIRNECMARIKYDALPKKCSSKL